jgi:hypothetical protein
MTVCVPWMAQVGASAPNCVGNLKLPMQCLRLVVTHCKQDFVDKVSRRRVSQRLDIIGIQAWLHDLWTQARQIPVARVGGLA